MVDHVRIDKFCELTGWSDRMGAKKDPERSLERGQGISLHTRQQPNCYQ